MRFTWKLLLLVASGVAMQALISRYAAEIDEAQFGARCLIGKLCGQPSNDPALLDAANALRDRHWARILRRQAAAAAVANPADQPTTQPVDLAGSAADELAWSLAGSAEDDRPLP